VNSLCIILIPQKNVYIKETTWPSGLRRAVQVGVSSEAWVQTPQLSTFALGLGLPQLNICIFLPCFLLLFCPIFFPFRSFAFVLHVRSIFVLLRQLLTKPFVSFSLFCIDRKRQTSLSMVPVVYLTLTLGYDIDIDRANRQSQ
jgi:hypothetical protein